MDRDEFYKIMQEASQEDCKKTAKKFYSLGRDDENRAQRKREASKAGKTLREYQNISK